MLNLIKIRLKSKIVYDIKDHEESPRIPSMSRINFAVSLISSNTGLRNTLISSDAASFGYLVLTESYVGHLKIT